MLTNLLLCVRTSLDLSVSKKIKIKNWLLSGLTFAPECAYEFVPERADEFTPKRVDEILAPERADFCT